MDEIAYTWVWCCHYLRCRGLGVPGVIRDGIELCYACRDRADRQPVERSLLLAEVELELAKRRGNPPADPALAGQNRVGESGGLPPGDEAEVVAG